MSDWAMLLLLLVVVVVAVTSSMRVKLFWRPRFIASLKGKHVVVTGGSAGIGFAVARQCVVEGAFVTLMARNEHNLRSAQDSLEGMMGGGGDTVHGRIRIQRVDAGDAEAVRHAIRECFGWRPIDVLICNAGVVKSEMLEEMSIRDLDSIARTNLMGSVYPVHAALPLMKKRSPAHPSSIVFMSSTAALAYNYGGSMYTATKYGQRGLAEALRLELWPHNIRVSVICPGFTETRILDSADDFQGAYNEFSKVCLYNRRAAEAPEDVARATIEGLKRGEFLVTTRPLGFALGVLSRGIIPPESMGRAFAELMVLVPLRMLSFAAGLYLKRVLLKKYATSL